MPAVVRFPDYGVQHHFSVLTESLRETNRQRCAGVVEILVVCRPKSDQHNGFQTNPSCRWHDSELHHLHPPGVVQPSIIDLRQFGHGRVVLAHRCTLGGDVPGFVNHLGPLALLPVYFVTMFLRQRVRWSDPRSARSLPQPLP